MIFSSIIKILADKNRKIGRNVFQNYAISSTAVIFSFVLLVLIGIVDYKTGNNVTFMPFYAVPVALVAWYGRRWMGVIAAIAAGAIWLWADLMAGQTYSNVLIPLWDMLGRTVFFLSPVFLVELYKSFAREKDLSRHDYLTGVLNRKGFNERLAIEVERSKRHNYSSTFITLDCDNFKYINDHYGHQVGDSVLRLVASTLKASTRMTDVVARMGGDEFTVFLSDADYDFSKNLITRLGNNVLDAMKKNNLPVTVSMGAVTYKNAPDSIDDLLKESDALMYFAKKKGKNAVEHEVLQ